MDLLGGYGSDGSSSDDEGATAPAPKKPRISKPPAGGTGKKVINFAKLPVSRPLLLDDKDLKADDAAAPLQAAADAEKLRRSAGFNLLAALPPPKVTLGLDGDLGGGGSRIDLSEVKFSRSNKQVDVIQSSGGIMRAGGGPKEVTESGEVPQDVMNHPMFRNDATAGAGGDRPSLAEIDAMKERKFKTISGADMQDPDWYMNNQMSGGPGLHSGKSVKEEVSMYEAKTWAKTTHANPSQNQKKKHQINWLAHEAMEKEAEMLDRASSSRLTKAQTSMKYGW